MSGALAARAADTEGDKGRVAATKVQRYRAGTVPSWVDQVEGGDVGGADAAPKERTRTEGVAAPVIVKRNDDPRLRRLAQRHTDEDREDALQRRREIRAPEIVRRGRHGDTEEDAQVKEEEEEHEGDAARGKDSDRPSRRRHAEDESGAAEEDRQEEGGRDDDDGGASGRHGDDKAAFLGGRMQVPVEDEEEVLRKRQAVRERWGPVPMHATHLHVLPCTMHCHILLGISLRMSLFESRHGAR